MERRNDDSGDTMRIILTLVLLCALGCTNANTQASADECFRYEPAIVDLKGTMIKSIEYGPPNYGEDPEHDAKMEVVEIELDKAVNVCRDPASNVNTENVVDIKKIQLIFLTGDESWRELVGHRVVATGSLSAAVSGHHFTSVVLNVKRIRLNK